VKKFSVIYLKSKPLDLFILISFIYNKTKQKITLDAIKLFKNKEMMLSCIEKNNLNLFEKNASKEQIKILDLKDYINDYLSGEDINLYEKVNDLNIDLGFKNKFPTSFSQKVIETIITIKRGEVTTYSDIGKKINSKAFRAIGTVLRKNPLPLILPCHRVIKKNGNIGGFMGNTDNKWQQDLKKKLLNIESYRK